MLYLDHAATAPLRPEVLEAMRPYLTGVFGNPSSHHTIGEAAAEALEWARGRVASALGMRAGDVIFTSGGTEANNLAVKGIVLGAMDSGATRCGVVTTPIEHESILVFTRLLAGPMDAKRQFAGDDQRRDNPRFSAANREKLNAFFTDIEPVRARLQCSFAQLMIAWTTAAGKVTVALCGARTPKQAIENARAGAVVLGAEDLRHIDAAADRHLGALMG